MLHGKMKKKNENELQEGKRIGIFGGISGGLGVLGLHNVCHAACEAVIIALAAVGIGVVGMPLLFLQDYSLFFSIMGIASAGAAIGYYVWKKKTCGMIFGRRQNFWLAFNVVVMIVSFGSLFANFGLIVV
ncbi:MAG TPA: hypothetical protein VJJ76_03785 [archaeon]|nr:hypothetical protein [archaeon]